MNKKEVRKIKAIDSNEINTVGEKKPFLNAKSRNIKIKYKKLIVRDEKYRAAKHYRRQAKRQARAISKSNINVMAGSDSKLKLTMAQNSSNLFKKLTSNKWARRSLYGFGAAMAFSLVEKLGHSINPKPVIPNKYERGYDVMSESMTDFGSPLHLIKTASKVLVPYHSSVRKGIITNTNSILNSNLSLVASKNAIKHTRY